MRPILAPFVFALSSALSAMAQTPGSVDPFFKIADNVGPDFGLGWRVLAAQPDGKIIVGRYPTHSGIPLNRVLARLEANGRYDESFRVGPVTLNWNGLEGGPGSMSAAIQSDGKILIQTAVSLFLLPDRSVQLLRLQPNGEVDNGFAPVPNNWSQDWFDLAFSELLHLPQVLPDGGILLGLLRLQNDGTVDTNFVPAVIQGVSPNF